MATASIAPSAGAETSTGTTAAASPTAGSAPLTDDQILGIGSPETGAGEFSGAKAPDPADADVAAEAATPESADSKTTRATDNQPNDPTANKAITPEIREFFKAHPEVRDAWYRAQEFSKLFPDFKTAELVASQIAQYENASELADDLKGVADLKAIDGMFYSGDPSQHAQIVENLFRDNPEAFGMLLDSLPETLLRLAGDATRPDLAQRARQLYDAWAPQTADAKLARLQMAERQLEERARQSQAERAERWVGEANEQVVRDFTGAVEQTVEQLAGNAYSGEAKRLLVGEIYRRVDQSLENNSDLVGHVGALLRGGAGDPKVQRQVVRLISTQAKRMIPAVAEKVIGAFGQASLATTGQRQRRDAAAAGRVDVTGSSGLDARGVKATTPAELRQAGKYRQLSDDDILDGRL
ncbi:MAG TPA: hypothetical protein VNJ52_13455 [Patescibacteria group bacterium]|nr:hypothetical protein [Patescibacteria group bacterium]